MKYNILGKTGIRISAVSYGGIVSAGFYDGRNYPEWDQAASDRYVQWAVEKGVNYFDVAPSYGNAQEQLGNSLAPYRDRIALACKTGKRERVPAEEEMLKSLEGLICQIHVKDGDGKQMAMTPLGTGNGRFPECAEIVMRSDYRGWIILENEFKVYGRDNDSLLKNDIRTMKRVFSDS